ncbi:MAG: DUF4339 domain-containing protein [Alloprevotella sp.]|nr:DUF4339 domain-containing protein [Alloprevotella sp.]
MSRYYFTDANFNAQGPLEAAELHQHGVTKDTLVWQEGMDDWMPAEKIPELRNIIERDEQTDTHTSIPIATPLEEIQKSASETVTATIPPPIPRLHEDMPLATGNTLDTSHSEDSPTKSESPRKSSNSLLWVLVGVLGTLLIVGVIVVVYMIAQSPYQEYATQNEPIADTIATDSEDLDITEDYQASMTPYGAKSLNGSIQSYGVHLDLHIANDGTVSGSSYYTKYGDSNRIRLSGNYWPNGHMELDEWSADGSYSTGAYSGNFDGRNYSGQFYNTELEKTMHFSLTAE